MNKRLDLLLRKNKGKKYLDIFKRILLKCGFFESEFEYVELEKFDEIIEQMKYKFENIIRETDLLHYEDNFVNSNIIKATYLSLNKNDICYIYTDDSQCCGMFICNAKRGFDLAFEVAKNDFQNTCFILDVNFNYYLLVNCNDENDNNYPNSFDIQLVKSSE